MDREAPVGTQGQGQRPLFFSTGAPSQWPFPSPGPPHPPLLSHLCSLGTLGHVHTLILGVCLHAPQAPSPETGNTEAAPWC